jgi:hypothetical protein
MSGEAVLAYDTPSPRRGALAHLARAMRNRAVALQRDRHLLRLCVLSNVGQRFLHDAIERDAASGGKPDTVVRQLNSAGHARSHAELAALPFQRGADTEIVKERRAEVLDNAAFDLDGVVDRRHDANDPRALRLAAGETVGKQLQIDLGRYQRSPEFNVNLPRAIFAFSSSCSFCR